MNSGDRNSGEFRGQYTYFPCTVTSVRCAMGRPAAPDRRFGPHPKRKQANAGCPAASHGEQRRGSQCAQDGPCIIPDRKDCGRQIGILSLEIPTQTLRRLRPKAGAQGRAACLGFTQRRGGKKRRREDQPNPPRPLLLCGLRVKRGSYLSAL